MFLLLLITLISEKKGHLEEEKMFLTVSYVSICNCLKLQLLILAIFKESALGRFFHRVAMSVYVFIYLSPFHVIF